MTIYCKNSLEIFFFRTQKSIILELGMHHKSLNLEKVYINDDPGLTLTYFAARSYLVAFAFEWENLLESHLMGQPCSK